MRWTVSLALATSVGLASAASAQVTVAAWNLQTYRTNGTGGPMTPVPASSLAANVTASDLGHGPGFNGLLASGSTLDPLRGSGPGHMLGYSFSQLLTADDYFQFSVSPKPGYAVRYQLFNVPLVERYLVDNTSPGIGRSAGPRKWELHYSLDGFATPGTPLFVLTGFNMSGTANPGQQILYTTEAYFADAPLTAIGTQSGTVTFRLYGYDIQGDHPNYPMGMPGGLGNGPFFINFPVAVRGQVVTVCYADCDPSSGPGALDIFDFLCFQNRFAASQTYACECDTSTGPGVCDIFDFLCFQNAFAAGCP